MVGREVVNGGDGVSSVGVAEISGVGGEEGVVGVGGTGEGRGGEEEFPTSLLG